MTDISKKQTNNLINCWKDSKIKSILLRKNTSGIIAGLKIVLSLQSVFSMVDVAQLVRALDCGSRGRGFKSHLAPRFSFPFREAFFLKDIDGVL